MTAASIGSSAARPTATARATRWASSRQPLDPHHEGVAQALRRGAAAVEPGGQQLLGVQRVALAAREQALDQRCSGSAPRMSVSASPKLVAVERLELDPPRALEPLELGEQRAQRVAAVQLVGPVGEQQHTRSWRRLRARKATNVRVERSAQCMSSRISTSGATAVRQSSSSSSASNSRSWSGRVGRSLGRSRLLQTREDRRELRPAAGAERRRARDGARGRAAAARSAAARTAARRRPARRRRRAGSGSCRAVSPPAGRRCSSSPTRRVLPTPESPPSRTSAGPAGAGLPDGELAAPRARRPVRRSGCWSAAIACPKYRRSADASRVRRPGPWPSAGALAGDAEILRCGPAAMMALNWGCIPGFLSIACHRAIENELRPAGAHRENGADCPARPLTSSPATPYAGGARRRSRRRCPLVTAPTPPAASGRR